MQNFEAKLESILQLQWDSICLLWLLVSLLAIEVVLLKPVLIYYTADSSYIVLTYSLSRPSQKLIQYRVSQQENIVNVLQHQIVLLCKSHETSFALFTFDIGF